MYIGEDLPRRMAKFYLDPSSDFGSVLTAGIPISILYKAVSCEFTLENSNVASKEILHTERF